ncbi:biotin--[acetyl-CoA-carboxylase] ligase [Acidaminobacter sp. JC074]|uniref:biotin--[acetyl-CoA-carboxylase] ligase n=1 Tax=Acidaminobacter sp. JC074 TaxID=2530199 RepID=UPI001F0F6764|nr:biotin--[acetyl-CoA-carboxylase] ligase [Acidaminobacter sp. JC074]MCH4890723.1 biotin--[acetyl-CoA-carboxylase] ligase [Acidaminobacter sp. JC074]
MKSKILNILKKRENEFVSGAEISDALNISRQAVSKHINNLKKQGYHIESVSRKGHRLLETTEMYNQSEILSELKTKAMGKELVFLDTVGSTNDYAKKLAMNGSDKMVVISDEQTSGKGRLGRHWESEKGTGIWMSVVLKPDIEPSEAPKITQIAAASMVKAIEEETGADIFIKWPNDLILNKKKVCGILTEMSAELGGINYVIVGIGVNVNQSSMPDDLSDKAVSLKMGLDKTISRKAIVLNFLQAFEDLYDDFIKNKSLEKTIDICRKKSILIDKSVKLITKAGTRQVQAKDINEDGHLVIVNEDGKEEAVFYGEVSVRGLYEYVD